MAEAANLVSVDLSAIGEDDRLHALKCCRRLSGLMDDVVQAQNLTGASGSATAPWSPATQDLAAPIYAATLPDDYQQLVVVTQLLQSGKQHYIHAHECLFVTTVVTQCALRLEAHTCSIPIRPAINSHRRVS